jgi:serine/threonine-protein kinase
MQRFASGTEGAPAEPSSQAVRQQLARILGSRPFLKTDSLSRLLRFVVERELTRDRARLREQVIAEEVFSRRDFDPQADTIVRTQARRLRQRLIEYYRLEGRDQPILIVLEKGSYVPIFRHARTEPVHPPTIPDSSIVVLPFLNLTGNPDEEYFSDGLTEEVITALSRVSGLRVVARTSAFAFKAKEDDVRAIGQRLGVSWVLEGSVRRSGDDLRVTAQLIRAQTGFHLWSENYDRRMSEIFQVQDELARSIVATLLESQPPPAARPAPSNMEAYHLYLKGSREAHRVTTDGVQRAIQLFEQTMALDPQFAPAPAQLALTHAMIGWWGMAPAPTVLPRARHFAERALSLDPRSAEARLALAWIRFAFDHDVNGALSSFDELLEIAPGYPLAKLLKAYALLAVERHEEAAAAAREANDLDPLSVLYVYNQAVVAYFARRWADVEAFGQATLELAPEFAEGHLALGAASMETGRFEAALRQLERAISLNATIGREYVVICYCRMGMWSEAEAELGRLTALHQQVYVAPHRFAIATSAFPERDRIFGYLERAWEERDPRLIWLRAWPVFDHLREDPRYHVLSQRLGLT